MTQTNWKYYNYFLILSVVLIMGYFFTSLFFFNKTSASGEQAESYAKIIEQSDDILIKAYRMESEALGFIISKDSANHHKFSSLRCDLSESFSSLEKLEFSQSLAKEHIEKLDELIGRRKAEINNLMRQDSLEHEHHLMHGSISYGGQIMDSISEVLMDIRKLSTEYRDKNKKEAIISSNNTIFMLSIFGIVMILIVFISFNKMKVEIQSNDLKNREIGKINSALKSVNENLENFAYVASHDLNEPLRKIRTFGEMVSQELKSENTDKEAVIHHIERMQSASQRMQTLIHDLLSYSRVNKNFDDNDVINLNEIIKVTLSDLQIQIKEKDAAIKIKSLPNEIVADEVQMRQLFQNLISNAIKFSHPKRNPKVEIETEEVAKSELPTVLHDKGFSSFYKISIRDNGIGFENEKANDIFAVFKRLHGKNEYEGTGIGLSICKKIVDIHQGLIIANSKPEEGSVFTIYLPAVKNDKL